MNDHAKNSVKSSGSSCSSCGKSDCSAKQRKPEESQEEFLRRQKIEASLCKIRHTFLVLSGKGGVGKSTVAVNLAMSLAMEGYKVGLLDIDIHGPSVPTMLGLTRELVFQSDEGGDLEPVRLSENLSVMSIGFFLERNDQAVVWRGPMKTGMIRQFLADVNWGNLDALIVDCPPGTGDEPLSIIQAIPNADGAIVVTTPQEVALADVRRSISFCRLLKLPVIGLVENMSGLICPHCSKSVPLFKQGGGKKLAAEMDIPFLGAVPLDPTLVTAADNGEPYIAKYRESAAARAFLDTIKPLLVVMQTDSCKACGSTDSEVGR